jgi:hypothetical protein
MTGRQRLAAVGIGLGLLTTAVVVVTSAEDPGAATTHRHGAIVASSSSRATGDHGFPIAWRPTVVAPRFVDDVAGPHTLRYGTRVPTWSLTRFGEHVRSLHCAFASCWAIGVTSQGYQYPLTRPARSRTWRIGGPWFSGAWANAPTVAARIQILSPKAVIAFTHRNWAYLSTDRGQDWSLVGLGRVVRAAMIRSAGGAATYRVTAQTIGTPVEQRDYVSTNGVVWRLAHDARTP